MNPIFDIFNYQYITQQNAQQKHFSQINEVQKCAKALKDFLESSEKIEEPYQKMAFDACCAVLIEYKYKNNK